MRYLGQTAIIFGITMTGEFLNYLLPFPVPAGVYGLFILLALLCTGIIKDSQVSDVGSFFLDIMPLMFLPAGVGLLNSVDELRSFLIPLTVITSLSTVFVMVITGKAAQHMIRRRGQEDDEAAGKDRS